jgi:beta-glucosidase
VKSKKWTSAILATAALVACSASMPLIYAVAPPDHPTRPWMNTSLPPDKRAELLIHAMTLDEKIEQIHMADVKDRPREIPGIERLGIATFKITNGPAGAGPGDSRVPVPATQASLTASRFDVFDSLSQTR